MTHIFKYIKYIDHKRPNVVIYYLSIFFNLYIYTTLTKNNNKSQLIYIIIVLRWKIKLLVCY